MNGKKLMEGLSYVDDRYLEEAEETVFPRRCFWTRPAATLAACAAALALVILGVGPDGAMEAAPDNSLRDDTGPGETFHSIIAETEPSLQAQEAFGTVRLRVEERSDGTFTVVAESSESDAIPLGEKLTLVLEGDQSNPETDIISGAPAMDISVEKGTEEKSYLTVRVLSYDPETGVLRGELVPANKEGD